MPMMDDRRRYALVGVFVLAMAVALVAWLAALAGHTGRMTDYLVYYDNVLGLDAGTRVYFEGHRVGVVDSIRPGGEEAPKRFEVRVRVDEDWEIPEDSRAEITASGLLSAFLIDIRAGESAATLPPGGVIEGVEMANVFDLVADVAAEFTHLTQEGVMPLLETASTRTPVILENLETFSAELNRIVGRVNGLLGPDNTDRVERILGNLESTSGNFASVSAGLADTRARIDELLDGLAGLVEENQPEVGRAVADLQHSLESVATHIDAINHNLEATTRNMNEFSDQLRRNPGVLIRGREAGDDGAPAR